LLGSGTVLGSAANWAAQQITIPFNVAVEAGTAYGIELVGNNTTSAWEYAYSNTDPYEAGVELVSTDGGSTWAEEPGKSLGFSVTVGPTRPPSCFLAESPESGFVAVGSDYFFNLSFGTAPPPGASLVWNGTKNGALDAVNVPYGESNINQWAGANSANGSSAGTYTRSFSLLDSNENVLCQSNTVTITLAAPTPLAAPTAPLTANGASNATMVTTVGEVINYTWSTTNAMSTTCTYTVDGVGSIPWVCGNTLSGTDSGAISSSQAGHTYTITYAVTGPYGQTASSFVTVQVSP
jgi:hypothetical protein